jgi:hypothetical protein
MKNGSVEEDADRAEPRRVAYGGAPGGCVDSECDAEMAGLAVIAQAWPCIGQN